MKYLMTKRTNHDGTPSLGFLIIKKKDTKWKGYGHFCGWYSWCGYRDATIVAKYFPESKTVKVIEHVGDLIADVYDDMGSETKEFTALSQRRAVAKFIKFLQ